MYAGFHPERLDDTHVLFRGRLPDDFVIDAVRFAELWELRPATFPLIQMHGRLVPTPRWQQPFGRNYYFKKEVAPALPIPPALAPFLAWAQEAIDPRLNGLLLNWYDAALGHYIGRHRDKTRDLVAGAPIVTISLGEERLFRLRPWKGRGAVDFPAADRSVFVLPYETNQAWTHEVPHRAGDRGRRISVTVRAFE